jgi:hypothetical protein
VETSFFRNIHFLFATSHGRKDRAVPFHLCFLSHNLITADRMIEVVEYLPGKYEPLSSNQGLPKKDISLKLIM